MFYISSKLTTMKKAPKRYFNGGGIKEDPKKKKIVTGVGVNTPATNLADAKAKAGIINKTQADIEKTQNFTEKIPDRNTQKGNVGLGGAGGFTASKEPYQNELGTYVPSTDTQYDKAGKVIPKKAKGGMVKAPKIGKKKC